MNFSKGEISFLNRFKEELEADDEFSNVYVELYEDEYDDNLALILSSFHNSLNQLFKYMNGQLSSRYFHADFSRDAFKLFDKIKSLLDIFKRHKLTLCRLKIPKYYR